VVNIHGMSTLTTLPSVETPNLLVCEMALHHAKAFSGFMIQPRYQRYTTLRLRNEAEVGAFVARTVARQGDDRRNVFHLAAEERASGEAIGDGFIISHRDNAVEVGWGVHPAMWACGFGSEIGGALLGLGFERLKARRVWCKIMTANTASAKLAARIGMRFEKQVGGYAVGDGRIENVDIYAMASEDYFNSPY
jgi:[ribosomal protein S5]-alanine N-acetyltransferase